jgi:hypothetical protein
MADWKKWLEEMNHTESSVFPVWFHTESSVITYIDIHNGLLEEIRNESHRI